MDEAPKLSEKADEMSHCRIIWNHQPPPYTGQVSVDLVRVPEHRISSRLWKEFWNFLLEPHGLGNGGYIWNSGEWNGEFGFICVQQFSEHLHRFLTKDGKCAWTISQPVLAWQIRKSSEAWDLTMFPQLASGPLLRTKAAASIPILLTWLSRQAPGEASSIPLAEAGFLSLLFAWSTLIF